jgi:hypothetical protein
MSFRNQSCFACYCKRLCDPFLPIHHLHIHTGIRVGLSTPAGYNGDTDGFSGWNGIFQTHFLRNNIALCYHLHQVKIGIYHESMALKRISLRSTNFIGFFKAWAGKLEWFFQIPKLTGG